MCSFLFVFFAIGWLSLRICVTHEYFLDVLFVFWLFLVYFNNEEDRICCAVLFCLLLDVICFYELPSVGQEFVLFVFFSTFRQNETYHQVLA